jgi:hypothetical protein
MAVKAKPASDNYVKVSDIGKAADAAALHSITSVTASIRAVTTDANGVDQPGSELSGSSASLTVVTSEPDAYEGFIPASVALVHGTKYFLKVVTVGVLTDGGASRTLTEHHPFVADHSKPRTFAE